MSFKLNVFELSKTDLINRARYINPQINFKDMIPQQIRVWLVENYPHNFYYGVQPTGAIGGRLQHRGAYVGGVNQAQKDNEKGKQYYTNYLDASESDDDYESDFVDDDIVYEDFSEKSFGEEESLGEESLGEEEDEETE